MEKKNEWYLPSADAVTPDGPFTQEEIVSKIATGEVTMDQFIWGSHFSEVRWMRVMELPEFALNLKKYPVCPIPKKRSRGLSQQAPTTPHFDFSKEKGEYGIENEYRRFPRAPFATKVIIHNQKKILNCMAVDISEKGLSLQTEESTLFDVGDEIIVTLLDTPFMGTFSMHATVMRSLDKPRGYGIYFLTVSPNIKRNIAQYVIESLGLGTKERKIA